MENLTKLKRLDLDYTDIKDHDLAYLFGLEQLEALNLSGNRRLTKDRLNELQKALPSCSIFHNAKPVQEPNAATKFHNTKPVPEPNAATKKNDQALSVLIMHADESNDALFYVTKEIASKVLEKPTGEVTYADIKMMIDTWTIRVVPAEDSKIRLVGDGRGASWRSLCLYGIKLANVMGLEKLDQLKELRLYNNPDLTKAQIDQLQKTLPKVKIYHDTTK